MSMTQEIRVTNYPEVLTDRSSHYCPGCHHGTAHRLVAEAITDLGLVDKTILIGSIGCSVFIYNYLSLDAIESPHGRAPAGATGAKRARPAKVVDDDRCAFFREQLRISFAKTIARASDDGDLPVKKTHVRLAP